MIRSGVVVGILFGLLLGAGCASTQLESESYVNQGASGKQFQRIMVLASISDFGPRTQAEQAFVERLTRGSTQALASATLMTPDRKYTEADFNTLLVSWSAVTGHLGYFASQGIPDVDGANAALAGLMDLQRALGGPIAADVGHRAIGRAHSGFDHGLARVGLPRSHRRDEWIAAGHRNGSGLLRSLCSRTRTVVAK